MRRLLIALLLLILGAASTAAAASAFDHRHAAWDALLKKNVRVIAGGNASQVRYASMQSDRPLLRAYLTSVSAVSAGPPHSDSIVLVVILDQRKIVNIHGLMTTTCKPC